MSNSLSSRVDRPANSWQWESVALWLALFFATSHVLADLAEHWIADPWSRYSLPFALLLVLEIWRSGPAAPNRWIGVSLIALAMLGVLGAVLASVTFAARPCLAMALIGALLYRGTTAWRTALLALWIIPVPSALMRALAGVPTGIDLFEIAAFATSPLGVEIEVQGRVIHSAATRLVVAPHHGGLVALVHLAGLVWYTAASRAASWPTTFKWLVGAALLALPVQILANMLTLVLLQFGVSADVGTQLGDLARWLVPTVVLLIHQFATQRGRCMPPRNRPHEGERGPLGNFNFSRRLATRLVRQWRDWRSLRPH